MNKNTRTKIQLKEEVVSQITLNDLLDLSSKAQVAIIQLTDNCMKFDNPQLRKAAAEVNKQVSALSDQIKGAIINNQNQQVTPPKEDLDVPGERPERHGDNNMIEAFKGAKKSKIIKKLLEALMESTEDDTTEEEDANTVSTDDSEDTNEETTEEVSKKEPKSIDLSSAFTSIIDGLTDEQFASFKTDILNSLKGSGITDPSFQEKVNNIESAENVDDFNFALDALYDYADENEIEIKTEPTTENVSETEE